MDEQKTLEVPAELNALSQLVEREPESFASGSSDISATALKAAKFVFDFCTFSFNKLKLYLHISLQQYSLNLPQDPT